VPSVDVKVKIVFGAEEHALVLFLAEGTLKGGFFRLV